MTSIVQLVQIDSTEDIIKYSNVRSADIVEFGNGVIISKDGFIASVAHIIKNENINSYAFYNGAFHKLKIFLKVETERNKNYIDALIGKIEINPIFDFFEDLKFDKAVDGCSIFLKGYSRVYYNTQKNSESSVESKLIELESLCLGNPYHINNKHWLNFFSFCLDNEKYNGLSGSPIFNDQNNIIGLFKGGDDFGNQIICQALNINVILDMYNKTINK